MQVGKHFGAQLFTWMCFFPFYAVAGLPIFVCLPHYTLNFLVAFVLMECLAKQGTKQMIAWGVTILLALGLGGYVACGVVGLGVAVFLQGLARVGVVPMLLVVGVLKLKGTAYSEPLQASTLWQAVIGRTSVWVCNQMDLTLLMKALSYQKAINNSEAKILVGLVEVDRVYRGLCNTQYMKTRVSGQFRGQIATPNCSHIARIAPIIVQIWVEGRGRPKRSMPSGKTFQI